VTLHDAMGLACVDLMAASLLAQVHYCKHKSGACVCKQNLLTNQMRPSVLAEVPKDILYSSNGCHQA